MAKKEKIKNSGTKRARANAEVAPKEALAMADAVVAVKKFKPTKFDQSVECVVHLGIDPKQADQMVRGSVALPKGIGKTKRVIAFCQGDNIKKALAAGAIKAGGDELVTEVEGGFMDFDVAIATPDMMRVVSKLGRVLGPKGLMPSPKAGTVTSDVENAVAEYSAGKIEYRNDKGGNIHAVIGKMSFPEGDLLVNLEHFVQEIERVRPRTVKGTYVKKVVICGSMTPGVQIKYQSAETAS
jgi:large subunit ribosomal protein L1